MPSYALYNLCVPGSEELGSCLPRARESGCIPRWTQQLRITKTKTQQFWSLWRVQSSCLGLAPTSSKGSGWADFLWGLNTACLLLTQTYSWTSAQGWQPPGKSWLWLHSEMGDSELSETWSARHRFSECHQRVILSRKGRRWVIMQRCEEEEKEREETVINTKDLFLSQFKSGDLSQMFVPKRKHKCSPETSGHRP